jgi:hypothetical protein
MAAFIAEIRGGLGSRAGHGRRQLAELAGATRGCVIADPATGFWSSSPTR